MDKEERQKKLEEALKMVNLKPISYDGVIFPQLPGVFPDPERKFKELYEFHCRESDIFVCSYPKSGTHWTLEVVSMLIKQSTDYDLFRPTDCFLELFDEKDSLSKRESPRLFTTHVPFRYLPRQLQNGTGKIVYVQRNPKDLHVSFHNFTKGKQAETEELTWNEYFEKRIIGETDMPYGSWPGYSKEWEKKFENKNILPLYYEEMKKDLKKNVLEISKFLNVSCSDDFAAKIAEKCTFEGMKKNKIDDTQVLNRAGTAGPTLYRKGEVGDWKNWFTVAQNERFDELYEDQMKDSNLKFLYEL